MDKKKKIKGKVDIDRYGQKKDKRKDVFKINHTPRKVNYHQFAQHLSKKNFLKDKSHKEITQTLWR